MYASFSNFHFPSIQVYFSSSDNLILNLSKPTIASYSVKERRSHTAMVAKFLGLNKLWSCQYGGEKTTKKFFCALLRLGMKGSLVFSFHHWTIQMAVRLCQGRLLIQKSCFHGNLTSHISIEAIFCGLFDNNNRSVGILKRI